MTARGGAGQHRLDLGEHVVHRAGGDLSPRSGDLGYIYRIRTLTDKHLGGDRASTPSCCGSSQLTDPSVVGDRDRHVHREPRRHPVGRSTAVVLVTALMDELFYVFTVPLVFLFVGMDSLFPPSAGQRLLGPRDQDHLLDRVRVHPGHGRQRVRRIFFRPGPQVPVAAGLPAPFSVGGGPWC